MDVLAAGIAAGALTLAAWGAWRPHYRADGDGFVSAPGHGRCEVICFSADHTGSFAGLDPAHARLVVHAWRHRTAELTALPGVAQVFCFENRGEEIGVTLPTRTARFTPIRI